MPNYLDIACSLLTHKKCLSCSSICTTLPLCTQCQIPFNHFDTSTQSTCLRCSEPSHATICIFCKKLPSQPSFKFLYHYTENTRDVIQKMKYTPSRRLLHYFGLKIINNIVTKNISDHWDAIIPIPSSKQALRKRKLHTTYLLAKPLSRIFKIPILPFVLENTSHSAQALTITTKERISHAKEHIRINKKYALLCSQYKKVLLLDDVMTSGASMLQAINILQLNGVKQVCSLSLMRSPGWYKNRDEVAKGIFS